MRRPDLDSQSIRARGLKKLAFFLFGLVLVVIQPLFPAIARQADHSPNSAPPPPSTDQPAPPPQPDKKKKEDQQPPVIFHWMRIEVVGGDDKKPVEGASVYVKFTEVHKVGKDKQIEFDLKTNQDGVARAPDVPLGKVEIQIVAPKWKPFGQFYEIAQQDQTIHIELVRPPRWY